MQRQACLLWCLYSFLLSFVSVSLHHPSNSRATRARPQPKASGSSKLHRAAFYYTEALCYAHANRSLESGEKSTRPLRNQKRSSEWCDFGQFFKWSFRNQIIEKLATTSQRSTKERGTKKGERNCTTALAGKPKTMADAEKSKVTAPLFSMSCIANLTTKLKEKREKE